MKKVKCHKCRKILCRYKDELEVSEGRFVINMECPNCKAITEIELGPGCENSIKKLKDESELEI